MFISLFEVCGPPRFAPSSTASCGDAGRSAAAPATPLSAPPRWVTSGRCCLPFQSPAPREQHPTGRRAAHAGSPRTWKKRQAQSRPCSSDAATNRGGVSPGGANVEPPKSLSGPAAPGPPRLGCPPLGRGAEGCAKPQRLLLSGCRLSSLLRLLPEVRAQAGSSLNLLRASLLDVQSASPSQSQPLLEILFSPVAVLQLWWRKSSLESRRESRRLCSRPQEKAGISVVALALHLSLYVVKSYVGCSASPEGFISIPCSRLSREALF